MSDATERLVGDPAMTVVMITRDRGEEARRAVCRLLELPERVHVVVVDNASAVGTLDLSAFDPGRLEVVRLDVNLGAAGRNVGVERAGTPYVAFADDDSAWLPGSLDRARRLLDAHPGLGLIAGAVLVGDERRLDPACSVMARSPLRTDRAIPGRPVLGFVACGSVVRRDAFLAVGGFDASYGVGGEERPLAIAMAAAGWSLAYVPACRAQHWPSPVRDPERRRRIVARNDLWSTWRYRRWPSAVAGTTAALRAAWSDPAARDGLRDAARRLLPVLRQRTPVARALERQLRALDRSTRGCGPNGVGVVAEPR
jgi:GT2 family glycosyltransferase